MGSWSSCSGSTPAGPRRSCGRRWSGSWRRWRGAGCCGCPERPDDGRAAAVHAGGGADVRVPAPLPLLLQSGGLRAAARCARRGGLAPGAARGRADRGGAGQPHGGRAAAAAGSRGADRGGAGARPVHEPDHLRDSAGAGASGAVPAARWVKELGFPLTVNTVLHRENLDRIGEVIALAEELKADRLELANAQYLGWALLNRAALLPTAAQLERARPVAAAARARLEGRMEVVFVLPDYYAEFPPPCMDGWGRQFMVVSPDGLLLPCLLAHTLPGLSFGNVRERSVGELWAGSPGMEAFRGEAWMPEPCRSCARRSVDYGGCRCQAFHLTGNAGATDPACSLSPEHDKVLSARAEAAGARQGMVSFRYREAR